ncbi:MAG: arylsulfatase [Verrucomicrobiota bacterium]
MKIAPLLFALILPMLAQASPPNIIVFLTDDQGWGDLSSTGNANLSTPHIDSLARDGASFDRFYVSPVCSPTRAEFLTGRYHQRSGVYSTSAGGERLDLDEMTVADSFKAAGYKTAAFGKWHNGMQYPYHPNGRGFDEFYGFCSGHWGNYYSPMLEHNGDIVIGEGFVVDDFTTQAIAFIEEHQEDPFFAYLPYNTPHSPMQVPDEFWDRFRDKDLTMRHRDPEKEDDLHLRAALAMCENIDWNVGRVLEALDDLGLSENTIVMYFCDNGPNGWRWNGGMKGKKGATDEGGVRSPMLIRWPAEIAAGTKVEVKGAAIDILPTLLDLTGVERIGKLPLDGVSLASALLEQSDGPDEELGNRMIFSGWRDKFAVRQFDWLLSHDKQLFDLKSDPGQEENVAKRHPDIYTQLNEARKAWRDEMIDELGEDLRPFVIADPGHVLTQVPARDANPHGNIERSNKFPNDSYFTNWISTEDRISWETEVAESGEFEVELFYTCAEVNVGSSLELTFGENRLVGKVDSAAESELLGAAQDRSPRMESYTQNWGRMTLGRISLDEGPGELVLKATEIPGSEVMDFRLLLLKRVE